MWVILNDHMVILEGQHHYNIAVAKARFSHLIQQALDGAEVIIAKDNKPVVKLVPIQRGIQKRVPGSAKGKVVFVSPDFDAPLEDFRDY